MRTKILKQALVGMLVGAGMGVGAAGTAAQDRLSSAANGGTAWTAANGGAAALGALNSGGNAGTVIEIGDTLGDVTVNGGAFASSTDLGLDLDGGTAISDASGGS
jgi:hypothetical protein